MWGGGGMVALSCSKCAFSLLCRTIETTAHASNFFSQNSLNSDQVRGYPTPHPIVVVNSRGKNRFHICGIALLDRELHDFCPCTNVYSLVQKIISQFVCLNKLRQVELVF